MFSPFYKREGKEMSQSKQIEFLKGEIKTISERNKELAKRNNILQLELEAVVELESKYRDALLSLADVEAKYKEAVREVLLLKAKYQRIIEREISKIK